MSDHTFFTVLFITSILFGLIMGAYYGTIEYRIRKNLPLITADCICPSCGHTLPLHHQIPLLSFLLLRGRCHFCHTDISIRYPLIEGGFTIYYGASYLIFRRLPIAFLILWYVFICMMLFLRCQRQYRSLLKGLAVMTGYHALISAVYLLIYLASYNSVSL